MNEVVVESRNVTFLKLEFQEVCKMPDEGAGTELGSLKEE